MEWDWNEVNGVTTLSAPAGAIQGPLQACLVFGVGRADETMPVAGITHLVEHLAFRTFDHTIYAKNGTVDTVCTSFVISGGPDDVVEFFGEIARNLRDVPVDHLDQEIKVLRVEEERSGTSQVGFDLTHRFGPRGVGLVAWPEHGLKVVGPDDVIEWARTWFTASNAALWTSGPLPAQLDLSALPQGDAPAHAPLPPSTPPARTFTTRSCNLVSVSAVMEHQPGVAQFLPIAQRRTYDRLRHRDALTYGVASERVRLDAGHSLVYLGADGTAGTFAQVFEGLVAVWDEIARDGPTEAEWADARRAREMHADHPQSHIAALDNDAERHVLGLPYIPLDEFWAGVDALTLEEARAHVAEIMPTLMGVAPEEVADGTAGWSTYQHWSAAPVDGTHYHPIEGREAGALVVGRDGTSWIDDDEEHIWTVRWDDAVCCFTWDDARRIVLGPTGEVVYVTPWNWRGGEELTARVDDAMDPARRIRMGDGDTQYLRDPDDPDSITDVRWLGSLVGALQGNQLVDLVIDTDGLFVLYSHQSNEALDARLSHLGRSDRETLLAEGVGNRWISRSEIELVELRKSRRWARAWGVHRVLGIRLHDGSTITVQLTSDDQVRIAGNQFRRLMGPYFQE